MLPSVMIDILAKRLPLLEGKKNRETVLEKETNSILGLSVLSVCFVSFLVYFEVYSICRVHFRIT